MFAFLSPRSEASTTPELEARVAERLAVLPQEDQVILLARLSGLMSDLRKWSAQPGPGTVAALVPVDQAVRAAYRSVTRRRVAGERALGTHRPEDVHAIVEECLLRLAQSWSWLALPGFVAMAPAQAPAEPAPAAAAVVARGLRAFTALLKWSYLCHAPVVQGVWADACRLLSCAEAHGLSRAWVRLDAAADWHSCVEREFLKGCMLATSGPERMSPPQLDAVERALEFCADALVLSPHEDRRLRFVIDLEDGSPPRPATGRFGAASRSLGLNCYDVRLDDLIKRTATGQLRASAFGPVLDQPLVLRTLMQVRERWTSHHH